MQNGHLADLHNRLPADWNDRFLADEAARLDVSMTDATAAALAGLDDEARMGKLGVKAQPCDVWQRGSVSRARTLFCRRGGRVSRGGTGGAPRSSRNRGTTGTATSPRPGSL
jgi:hypothetical protein